MNKKLTLILALMLTVAMLLTGCSSKEETTAAVTEAATTQATEATTAATAVTEPTEAATTEAATGETTTAEPTEAETTTAKQEETTAKPTQAPTEAATEATTAPTEAPAPKKDLVALMNSLYDGLEETPMVGQIEVTGENSAWYVGVENLQCRQALASEAMISSIAHSLVLIEVEDGTDVDALKKDIYNKIDPRKWVCTGVEREEVVIESVGNLIFVAVDVVNPQHFQQQFLANAK